MMSNMIFVKIILDKGVFWDYNECINRGISQGAEYCDVAIRNYLLYEVVVNLLTELIVLDGEA